MGSAAEQGKRLLEHGWRNAHGRRASGLVRRRLRSSAVHGAIHLHRVPRRRGGSWCRWTTSRWGRGRDGASRRAVRRYPPSLQPTRSAGPPHDSARARRWSRWPCRRSGTVPACRPSGRGHGGRRRRHGAARPEHRPRCRAGARCSTVHRARRARSRRLYPAVLDPRRVPVDVHVDAHGRRAYARRGPVGSRPCSTSGRVGGADASIGHSDQGGPRTRRDVSIPTPDGSCDASLHTPDGAGPWPAVIMFPDAGGVRPTWPAR